MVDLKLGATGIVEHEINRVATSVHSAPTWFHVRKVRVLLLPPFYGVKLVYPEFVGSPREGRALPPVDRHHIGEDR